ncbi:MAG TPA: hypothetical protein EYP34_00285 [Chromatiaceae bacterium]|nr:hypothetical protein [Chromatiaceae bacterium]
MGKEVVVRVHGKYNTFNVVKNSGTWSTKYEVYKDEKYLCSFSSRADAVRRAHKEAGPNAYES